MNIKNIAARLAAQNGISSKTAERLIEAEANLIKQYHRQLNKLSTAEIAQRRYTEDPGSSMIAAASAPLIFNIIEESVVATPTQKAAAQEYKAALNAVELEQMNLGVVPPQQDDEWIETTFSGTLHYDKVTQTYKVHKSADIEAVAKAGSDTAGIRSALPELEDDFRQLCAGEIDKDEYSARVTEKRKAAEDAHYSLEFQESWINPELYDTYGD